MASMGIGAYARVGGMVMSANSALTRASEPLTIAPAIRRAFTQLQGHIYVSVIEAICTCLSLCRGRGAPYLNLYPCQRLYLHAHLHLHLHLQMHLCLSVSLFGSVVSI